MATEEYKRTCKACGKVWHSLVSREQEILQRKQANAMQGAVGCCSPNTSATSIGTGQLIDSELQRLRQCPECGSANYQEIVVSYEDPKEEPALASSTQLNEQPESNSIDPEITESESDQTAIVTDAANKPLNPKKGIGCGGWILIFIGAVVLLSIISAIISSTKNNSSTNNSVGNSSVVVATDQAPVDASLPSGWTEQESQIWSILSATYPSISGINDAGKNALIDNAHLVCQAYSEGYSRIEILNATNNSALPSGLVDDLMTLAVTTFCPEYTNEQLQ